MELKDKYALTVHEAVRYFGIGKSKMYALAADHAEAGDFVFMNGNQFMIIREEFQKFLVETSSI